MQIFINNAPVEVNPKHSLADILGSQGIPAQGTAVAVNNKVVPKALWADTFVAEGCRLTVINAVCGG